MPSGDLQILNATHHDAGEYRCIANNPYLFKKVIAQRKVILRVESKFPNLLKIILSVLASQHFDFHVFCV